MRSANCHNIDGFVGEVRQSLENCASNLIGLGLTWRGQIVLEV